MLVLPVDDRYAIFSLEADDLYDLRLIRLEGPVKLLEIPVREEYQPDVYLSAWTVGSLDAKSASQKILVPPVGQFLTVDIHPDSDAHKPGEEGSLTVVTKDRAGKPISAEVALAVRDESVLAIQEDLAGDPKAAFYKNLRGDAVRTSSTFEVKRYVNVIPAKKNSASKSKQEVTETWPGGGGALSGRVTDESGQPVAGAIITVTGSLLQGPRGAATDVDGNFLIPYLPTGDDYSLKVEAQGYNSVVRKGIQVVLGRVTIIPVVLSQGKTEILVTAAAPIIDIKRTEVGANLGPQNSYVVNGFAAPRDSSEVAFMAPSALASGTEGDLLVVRHDFRSTAFWQPDVLTGADGTAVVRFKYPDTVTGWQAAARAVTKGSAFGEGFAQTRTSKPLVVRLQGPRFFVVGDMAVISAVMNNNSDKPLDATPTLKVRGLGIQGEAMGVDGESRLTLSPVRVPANGSARADWTIAAAKPGTASIEVTATAGGDADAMEMPYTVYEHGIEKFLAKSGKALGADVRVNIDLPAARRPGSTSLQVQVTPSLAVTMLDALPYLIDYPYGCTEQTMSRFLPAVIVKKSLKDLGIDADDVMSKHFGGIEQEFVKVTHEKGKKNLDLVNSITKNGLMRLYAFQHSDGGWGWWKEGRTDRFMSAYVLWGLCLAKSAGVKVNGDVLENAERFVLEALVEEHWDPDMQAWLLHALSYGYLETKNQNPSLGEVAEEHGDLPTEVQKAVQNLWNNRDRLTPYGRALFTIAAQNMGYREKTSVLVRNLEAGAIVDRETDTSIVQSGLQVHGEHALATAHWGADPIGWRWNSSKIETTATVLRALLAADPKNPLVDASMNWLVKNRRGSQWSNTRDTSLAILALAGYLRTSQELRGDLAFTLSVNGREIANKRLSPDMVLGEPDLFQVPPEVIKDGANEIRIVRTSGDKPLYFSVQAKFFSLEEPITPAGNEIFVRRQYFKKVGRPTLLKGLSFENVPIKDGDAVRSGDRVVEILTIEAKNDYEYLLLEDLKPAGLESVEILSGGPLFAEPMDREAAKKKFAEEEAITGSDEQDDFPYSRQCEEGNCWVYRELRDRKVVLFLDRLPQGIWTITYEMRAEVPGRFHGLPLLGHAMYVPEIRGNSDEVRIHIEERSP